MKPLYLVLCLLLVCITLHAQKGDIHPSGQYYFNQSLTKNSAAKKLLDKTNIVPIKRNHIVEVIDIENGEVYFSFLKFPTYKSTDSKELSTNFKRYNSDSSDGVMKVFRLSEEDFDFYTNSYLRSFTEFKVGSYTVPIRLRSNDDDFEFESNLSVGINVIKGYRFNRKNNNFRLDFSFGLALTKVNLNKNNSDIEDLDSDLETLSEGALTCSVGTLLHLTKNVNLGLFYGWDFLNGAEQKKLRWVHNKKPWVGIGINVAFSNKNSNNDGTKMSQTPKS